MATIISTKTSGVGGLEVTGDATGILQLASNNGTTGAELDASQLFKFNSGYGSVATAYGCRAWVNFNGTGTVAIRASGNVTSITDNGTGYYTVNMTNAMPDTNYNAVGAASSSGSQFNICFFNINPSTGNRNTPTTSAFTVGTGTLSAMLDGQDICVSVFR